MIDFLARLYAVRRNRTVFWIIDTIIVLALAAFAFRGWL